MSSPNTKLVTVRLPTKAYDILLRRAGGEPIGSYLRSVLTAHTKRLQQRKKQA